MTTDTWDRVEQMWVQFEAWTDRYAHWLRWVSLVALFLASSWPMGLLHLYGFVYWQFRTVAERRRTRA